MKYGVGAKVLVEVEIVEVRIKGDGTYYTVKPAGDEYIAFNSMTVKEERIVEDGE